MKLKTFETRTLVDFAHNFERLFEVGDYEGMASYYTNDATLLAAETDTVEGLQSIREFWRVSCQKANESSLKRTIEVDRVVRSGALGYALGRVRLEIPADVQGTLTQFIRYVTIWKESADGSWRIVVDISNTSTRDPGSVEHLLLQRS